MFPFLDTYLYLAIISTPSRISPFKLTFVRHRIYILVSNRFIFPKSHNNTLKNRTFSQFGIITLLAKATFAFLHKAAHALLRSYASPSQRALSLQESEASLAKFHLPG